MTTGSLPTAGSLLQDALGKLEDFHGLSSPERHLLCNLQGDPQALSHEIKDLEQRLRSSRKQKCLIVLRNAINVVQSCISTIDTFVPSSGGIALAWGAIKLTINLAQKLVGSFEKVTTALAHVSRRMRHISDYVKIYSGNTHVREALVDVYVDVFRLCITVRRIFVTKKGKNRNVLCILVRNALNPEMDDCVKQFDQHGQELKIEVEHVDRLNQDQQREHEKKRKEEEAARREAEEERQRQRDQEALEKRQTEETEREARQQRDEIERRRLALEESRKNGRDAFLARLKAVPADDDHHRMNLVTTPSSGSWFLQSKEYSDWANGNSERTLWCYGKPGCGKSVLTSVIINRLRRDHPGSGIAFFYCSFRSETRRDSEIVLHTLLHQVLLQTPLSAPIWTTIIGEPRHASTISLASVQHLLVEASTGGDAPRYMIIDGIDECAEDDRKILLSSLTLLGKQFRLLVVSRYEEELRRSRALCDATHLQIQPAMVAQDIEDYVARSVNQHIEYQRMIPLSDDVRSDMVHALVGKADGMFLWVALQIQGICEERTEDDVREAVRTLPRGLEETYARILHKIDKLPQSRRERVKVLLRWIVCVPGILKKGAVGAMVAVPAMADQWDPRKIPDPDSVIQDCYSLVECSSEVADASVPQVCHFTALEFLASNPDGFPRTIPTFHLYPGSAHLIQLAKSCVTVIRLSRLTNAHNEAALFALRSWAHPVVALATTAPMPADSRRQLCGIIRALSSHWRATYWPYTPNWSGTGSLHPENLVDHACYFCLSLAYGLPGSLSSSKAEKCVIALHIAVSMSSPQLDTIQALLKAGLNPNMMDKKQRTALHYATMRSSNCDADVIKALLGAHSNPNQRDEFGCTALHYAVAKNDVEVVRALLRYHASKGVADIYGQTPYQQAVEIGAHTDILRLLQPRLRVRSGMMPGALEGIGQSDSSDVA
ncbi:hypothetical protein PUNSTDRAFT_133707 [Punctularia strigosozonata HHB-11173 SS5]|uniref:uncharacterized protein n=1 Tax=Punctularia strigosozonata (strain HHB-11173) TaxID=741275 RepID=UPI0004416B33|nr:uncharacterized protein PUNSTDRAFT_133707 [Punctularia strigosozonata HHB-11173 SS5]EIN09934.1 hypothetical protein PUNSTDRAFT_133707 [Punctularia strigosozonata HHB-11173 SS5]